MFAANDGQIKASEIASCAWLLRATSHPIEVCNHVRSSHISSGKSALRYGIARALCCLRTLRQECLSQKIISSQESDRVLSFRFSTKGPPAGRTSLLREFRYLVRVRQETT